MCVHIDPRPPKFVVYRSQTAPRMVEHRLCIDMCVDMCVDTCADMCADICVDTRSDMCADMCLDRHGSTYARTLTINKTCDNE